jgi:hypothetical protein
MGGVLEHQALMVCHTYPGFIRSSGQPTYGYIQSSDRPDLYISRSSSQHACWLDSQLVVEDSWAVYQPAQPLTTSWMHGWLG